MRHLSIGAFSMPAVLLFLVAGNVQATPTERLEGRYLKSRIKLRIDEDWKVQAGNIRGAEAAAFDDSAWATTSVPHDMSITLVSTSDSDPGATGWYRKHFTLPLVLPEKRSSFSSTAFIMTPRSTSTAPRSAASGSATSASIAI